MPTRDTQMELPEPPQHYKDHTNSTQAIPIPPQYDDAYLQVLQSIANDLPLLSHIFCGQESAKKFGFAANILLTIVEINMNEYENGRY